MRPESDALPALKRGLAEGWALKNNVQKGRSAPSTDGNKIKERMASGQSICTGILSHRRQDN